MAQTLVKQLLHLVFSTKNRVDLITPEIEPRLFPYMTGIVRNCDSKLLAINGTPNHVHLLVALSKNWALAALLEQLKKDSSKWVKTQGPGFRDFYWQEGYGAFSIGEAGVAKTRAYIAAQKEHHRRRTFQEEFIAFLRRNNVAYDERYIWK